MVTSIEIQHKDILGRVLLLKIEVKVVNLVIILVLTSFFGNPSLIF